MFGSIDKSLHAGNIVASFGAVATAADITFCGGAAGMIGGALSGLAIFKQANPETQALAQQMAQRLDDTLSRASLNQSRRAIAAQMMKAYGPQADDIAQGNNDAARR